MNGETIHILLVEDNPDHAELLRRELEQFPFTCRLHHVLDGEAALDYVFGRHEFSDRARFPVPDAMLLDLRLPRLDGMEVLRLVKTTPATQAMPVLVLTTSDAERDVAAARGYGADHFLTKPADGDRLLQALLRLKPGLRAGSSANAPQSPAEPARV
jgi:CheY-like chemotaxis protein